MFNFFQNLDVNFVWNCEKSQKKTCLTQYVKEKKIKGKKEEKDLERKKERKIDKEYVVDRITKNV